MGDRNGPEHADDHFALLAESQKNADTAGSA